ncbi:uncharacterized protein LOC124691363 isoform X1 [Lolium rigidum]|uniref:uncharacterized protein LOC124691363 isoform X1 n=1 Tax=Lolium rigidum TaxID=89674 RepID=UPI001F5C8DA6|nr:uncharacterized protein LOC124691363 isoform X1 [Lolium rigidum]
MTRESMTVCLVDLQDLENSMRRHAIVDAFERHILHMWLFCVNQDSIVVHDALEDITQVQEQLSVAFKFQLTAQSTATSSQQAQRSMSTNRNKQMVRKSDPIYLHSLVCNVSMKTAMQSWIYKGLNLKSLGIWKSSNFV